MAGFSGNFFVKQQRDLGKVNGFIEEMMDGQKVVKVFCHEEENIENSKKLITICMRVLTMPMRLQMLSDRSMHSLEI